MYCEKCGLTFPRGDGQHLLVIGQRRLASRKAMEHFEETLKWYMDVSKEMEGYEFTQAEA